LWIVFPSFVTWTSTVAVAILVAGTAILRDVLGADGVAREIEELVSHLLAPVAVSL